MTPLTAKILTGATILVAVLLIVLTVAVYTVIPQAIQDGALEPVTIANPVEEVTVLNPVEIVTVANPVETVTVANPVEEVRIANPVDEVIILNPVDEVRVTNIVETAAPRNSSLWGYCFPIERGGYEISISAFSGGIEKVVAAGSFTERAANSISFEIADYYYGDGRGLNFGASSEECSHLEGWSSE